MTEPTPTSRCLLAATGFSLPSTLALQRAALHLAHVLLGSVTRHVLEEAEGDGLVSTAHGS